MKFVSSHLRSKYFTAKLFHLAKPNFTRHKANFVEKTTGRNLSFFLAGVVGFASLEPPAKQSTGLFFRLTANTQLKLLAPNSNPTIYLSKKQTHTFGMDLFFGRGSWIRTNEVTESESVALPLGDTPLFFLILTKYLVFFNCF